jgi:tRNA modification GTPase
MPGKQIPEAGVVTVNPDIFISLCPQKYTLLMDNSIICAISTPPGMGAIAVIRVSGEGAIALCDRLVRTRSGKKLSACPSRTVHFGDFIDEEKLVDEVIVALYRAPRSFTGEECVEISCHGSPYIQQRILQSLTTGGARLATPGEFTRRAFLNGKIDLSRAEAIADLIAANSAAAHDMAIKQMRGGFSNRLKELREELLRLATLVELELDFAEEDVTFADRTGLQAIAREIHLLVTTLRDSFALGNVLKTGIPVAIVGPPNAGKSTLLNTLLNEERAIVSAHEGTTRDLIEETLTIEGITFRFIDTAGIRATDDDIEAMGVARTFTGISRARIVLLLVDAPRLPSFPNHYEQVRTHLSPDATRLILLNKIDNLDDPLALLASLRSLAPGIPLLPISAKTGANLDSLSRHLLSTVTTDPHATSDIIVSNARHHASLTHASHALARLLTGLETSLSSEFLSQDIRECLHHLGEITGEITSDEILSNIFKNFCIGK